MENLVILSVRYVKGSLMLHQVKVIFVWDVSSKFGFRVLGEINRQKLKNKEKRGSLKLHASMVMGYLSKIAVKNDPLVKFLQKHGNKNQVN